MEIINWLLANLSLLVAGVVGVLTALIALFLIIPGEQPEKFLQGVLDFIKPFSKK